MKERNLYGCEISEALELEGQNFSGECLGNAGIENYLKEKKDNKETSELLKEFYNGNRGYDMVLTGCEERDLNQHTDFATKLMYEIIDKFFFLNGPILSKIDSLRSAELQKIYLTCEEFKQFKESLPKDQHITTNGYLIYRRVIETKNEGLPGFDDEIHYEYKYDNPAEDITILFGSEEYCKQIKELKSQLISWEDFCKKYYDTPYEYHCIPKNTEIQYSFFKYGTPADQDYINPEEL